MHLNKILALLICIYQTLVAGTAFAKDWYVLPDGKGKLFFADGRSPDTAWSGFRNIRWGGEDGVGAGDRLNLVGGYVYQEELIIPVSGSSSKKIIIKCFGEQDCVLDGQGKHRIGIYGKNIQHIEIDGISVRGYRNSGIRVDGEVSNIIVRNCKSHNNRYYGLQINALDKTASKILIEKNTVFSNGENLLTPWRNAGGGVLVTTGEGGLVTDVEIVFNELYKNYRYGVSVYPAFGLKQVAGEARNILVENNYTHQNGGSGIDFSKDVMHSSIVGNIAEGNGWGEPASGIHVGGVRGQAPSDIVIQDNTVLDQEFRLTDGAGILVDDYSDSIAVLGNKVGFNEEAGIKLHNSKNILVSGNLIVSNEDGIKGPGASNYSVIGNWIIGEHKVAVKYIGAPKGITVERNFIYGARKIIPSGKKDGLFLSGNCVVDAEHDSMRDAYLIDSDRLKESSIGDLVSQFKFNGDCNEVFMH